MCGNRCVLFDNLTKDEAKKSEQLNRLLRLVDTVGENNGGIPYTNELFVDSLDISDNGVEANPAYDQEQLNRFLEKVFLDYSILSSCSL